MTPTMTKEHQTEVAVYEAPSKQQIVKATAIALGVALVIFLTAVLPAEYGIDPLHTGRALGLMSLAKATAAAPSGAPAETRAYQKAAVTMAQPTAAGEAPVITGVFVPEPARYKVDSREIKLDVGQGMEIKYHMQQGAGMVYSWTASKNIQFEFHGEPDVKPAGAAADYFESYEKNDVDGGKQSNGTFTAPSTGIEGWFWDNESEGPVTIKLVTAGFYDYILQNKDDVKTRLQPSDPQ
jgi:hypothetical protein